MERGQIVERFLLSKWKNPSRIQKVCRLLEAVKSQGINLEAIPILIIDDDQELTDLLVEFLSDFKYETVVYHHPLEGLKYLKKKRVNNLEFHK